MFYDVYKNLCEKHGLTLSGAATQIGFNRASVTVWKNTGKAPKQDLLLKIADFFNVTTDYLLGNEEQKEKPAPTNGDGLSPEDAHIMDMIRQLTPENKRKFAEKLEVLLEFQEPSPDSQA